MIVAAAVVALAVGLLASGTDALKFEHRGSASALSGKVSGSAAVTDADKAGAAVARGADDVQKDVVSALMSNFGFDYLSCLQFASPANITMCEACKVAMKPASSLCDLANCTAEPNSEDDSKMCVICRRFTERIAAEASRVANAYCRRCAMQVEIPCLPSICRLDAPCATGNQTGACVKSVETLCKGL